jgi:streptomycin 6-kinase
VKFVIIVQPSALGWMVIDSSKVVFGENTLDKGNRFLNKMFKIGLE